MKHKPLGQKTYGSIPHLPGSRQDRSDIGLSEKQAAILTTKARDRHDIIIVQEKIDGSNVCIAKDTDGRIYPLNRAGYICNTSPYIHHRMFYDWVHNQYEIFDKLLNPGERLSGEWIALAHGTRYLDVQYPFVPFDLFRNNERILYAEFAVRVDPVFPTANLLHIGEPVSVEKINEILGPNGFLNPHPEDGAEGAVWRVQRKGKIDFLGKFVRPTKVDGKYLPEKYGQEIWNRKMS